MTRDSIALANSTPYVPRSLPVSFTQGAGGGSPRGAGALPAAPVVPDLAPGTLELRPPPPATPEPYRIGVGDVVQLATRSAATAPDAAVTGTLSGGEVRQTYTVRDDGAIALPEVGAVQIGGLTIEDAEQQLFERFLDAGIDPDFSLEIAEFNALTITVGGDVGSSANVPVGLRVPTLDEALTTAGGLAVATPEYASIRIYRDGTLYQIPIEDFNERGDLRDVQLLPGGFDLCRHELRFRPGVGLLHAADCCGEPAPERASLRSDRDRDRYPSRRPGRGTVAREIGTELPLI